MLFKLSVPANSSYIQYFWGIDVPKTGTPLSTIAVRNLKEPGKYYDLHGLNQQSSSYQVQIGHAIFIPFGLIDVTTTLSTAILTQKTSVINFWQHKYTCHTPPFCNKYLSLNLGDPGDSLHPFN